ncbi:MAG: ribosome small subunit-dependent GTPase A [Clostridia bacterium]|nr:ribosome small subunit-dependent GTPase A [Clostridia bacterium]
MEYKAQGRIVKGIGGLYFVSVSSCDEPEATGKLLPCRARGKFRHSNMTPLVGDTVEVVFNERTLTALNDEKKDEKNSASEIMISEIINRKNALIRPPLANLDYMFISMASASPAPILSTVDKLISIAEFNEIEPVIVIGKCELDKDISKEIFEIYKKAGFKVFTVSVYEDEGIDVLSEFVNSNLTGKIAAFAGASGVGKSSLMNKLFPHLRLDTGEISKKIERGKNTTRHVELFAHECRDGIGYIADTPGFSMLDFEHFDFFKKDDLPLTMREFNDYIGLCKYTKCTHTKEEGCAILDAVTRGDIAKSRHDSFLEMYDVLKNKPDWKK